MNAGFQRRLEEAEKRHAAQASRRDRAAEARAAKAYLVENPDHARRIMIGLQGGADETVDRRLGSLLARFQAEMEDVA